MSPRSAFLRVTLANFFFFLNFASFFLLPLHVHALGGSEATIGVVMGTAGVAGLLSLAAVGPLLDRVGPRPFLLGGIATMSAAAAAYLFVDRIGPVLFALRAVQGFAFGATFNAASTVAARFATPERRAADLGLFGVSTLSTHALAPALGEVLVARAGFDALFAAAACVSLVGLGVAWRIPGAPAVVGIGSGPLRATRIFSSTLATVGCCGIVFGIVLTYVPTFVVEAALGPVATFFLTYTTAAVGTRLAGARLGDSLGRRRVVLPSLALLALAALVLAGARSPVWLAAAAALFGTAQGILYPTLNAFAIDQVQHDQLGRTQTLYNGAFNLGATGGTIALGSVAASYGYRATFLFAAGIALIAIGVFGAGTAAPEQA